MSLPRGLAIERSSQPFAGFGVWKDEHLHEQTLVSIRRPLAFMTDRTLVAFEVFERITRDAVFERWPQLGPVLPAMGYFPEPLAELATTIAAVPRDATVVGTPIDLARLPGSITALDCRGATAPRRKNSAGAGRASNAAARILQVDDRRRLADLDRGARCADVPDA